MLNSLEPYLAVTSDGRRFIVQAADDASARKNAMFPGDYFTIVATEAVVKFPDLLTARQLSDQLGKGAGYDTVLDWAKSGHIPSVRRGRKFLRFDLVAVKAALEGGGE